MDIEGGRLQGQSLASFRVFMHAMWTCLPPADRLTRPAEQDYVALAEVVEWERLTPLRLREPDDRVPEESPRRLRGQAEQRQPLFLQGNRE